MYDNIIIFRIGIVRKEIREKGMERGFILFRQVLSRMKSIGTFYN